MRTKWIVFKLLKRHDEHGTFTRCSSVTNNLLIGFRSYSLGVAVIPFALLRRTESAGESLLQRATRNHFSKHVDRRWWPKSVGPCLARGSSCFHDRHGYLDPTFCLLDGFYWQLYRHDALLHLAVLLPSQTERPHSRLGHRRLRLLRHLPRRPVWRHRHLLFVQSSGRGFPNRLTFLNDIFAEVLSVQFIISNVFQTKKKQTKKVWNPGLPKILSKRG